MSPGAPANCGGPSKWDIRHFCHNGKTSICSNDIPESSHDIEDVNGVPNQFLENGPEYGTPLSPGCRSLSRLDTAIPTCSGNHQTVTQIKTPLVLVGFLCFPCGNVRSSHVSGQNGLQKFGSTCHGQGLLKRRKSQPVWDITVAHLPPARALHFWAKLISFSNCITDTPSGRKTSS